MTPTIFIMTDGLRPDAITSATTPHLYHHRHHSSYSLTASSLMPTITLPCHMTIFHSIPASRHGILNNQYHTPVHKIVGLIDHAHQHGRHTAAFHNWEVLRDLNRPGSLDHIYYLNNVEETPRLPEADEIIIMAGLDYIHKHQPDFAFIYCGTVDVAGHDFGWMSPGYLEQATRLDAALGHFLAHCPPHYATLIHSDHGGHDRTHGTDQPADMLIPWFLAGPGIRTNQELTTPITLLDTAPTIAHLLDLPQPAEWEGQVVTAAFAPA
ncbi:MAG TPA: alkaline phosphatase family protein [Anaerolineae bacterium]|nr:alkaline phosphatase family protein [Anaerolineae bacterium]